MTAGAPKIDKRDQQEIAKQVRDLALYYCPEMVLIEKDKQADALIQIFSRMMGIIIYRLNKVPDKNFLTFLDLISISLSPPKVARAPLTFTMAKGESRYGMVRAGTQAATTQTKEKEAAVFETEKDLTIIQPKLVGAVSLNPGGDRWKDHTPVLISKKEKGIESLFEGNNLVPHRLYLGHSKLFSFKEKTTIKLDVKVSEGPASPENWEVKWYYFDKTLSKISVDVEGFDEKGNKDPAVANLIKPGTIIFKGISGISENTLTGFEKEAGSPNKWKSNWIFAELSKPIPDDKLPRISKITAGVVIAPPNSAGSGNISVDPLKVAGAGTAFTKELKEGYNIIIKKETNNITSIESDNILSIGSAFKDNFDNESFSFSSSGKGTISTNNANVQGINTIFSKELKKGDTITAKNKITDEDQIKSIIGIDSDNSLNVGSAFDPPLPTGTTFTYTRAGTGTITSNGTTEITSDGDTIFTKELVIGDSITVTYDLEYLFNWDEIQKYDDKRLLEFLAQKFGFNLAKTAKIEKIDDARTINVYTEKKYLSLKLNDEKTKVNLTIDDVQTESLIAKMEDGKLNIYQNKAETRIITAIGSDSSLTVDEPFSESFEVRNFTFTSAGTGTISSGTLVTGDKDTIFAEELKIGYSIKVNDQIRKVTGIYSDKLLIVDSAFENSLDKSDFEFLSNGTGTISSGTFVKGDIYNPTKFTEELKRGSSITVIKEEGQTKKEQTKLVTAIFSDASLTVDSAFDTNPDIAGFTYKTPLFPEKAFFNNFPLELTKDFYPFGEKPKFNDIFYIGSNEAFTKEGAVITIMVALSDWAVPDTENIKLTWEFWDGKSWMKIADTSQTAAKDPGKYSFSDETCAFKYNGKIIFKCPKIAESEINAEKNYWIRVRIIGGNYGDEATYEEKIDINGNRVWAYRAPTYKPPSISILTLNYQFEPAGEDFDVVLSYNDFIYQDKTGEIHEGKPFFPFQPVIDKQPALYLAFDMDISTLPVTLFFPLSEITLTVIKILEFDTTGPVAGATSVTLKNVNDLRNGDVIELCNNKGDTEQKSIISVDTESKTIKWNIATNIDFSGSGSTITLFPPPVLAWEYWNGKKWVLLQKVEDGTKNLTKRGLVQFLAPGDIQQIHCFEFDTQHYWIRARLINGAYEIFPKLKGIHTNTVWAHNVVTIKEEILGSSIAKPDQIFKYSRFPVIGKPELEVFEISITEEDKKNIISDEGKDAIKEVKDISGNISGYWVRWHEVAHFFSSKPSSRHYVIEHNSGEVTFGNGERGMIPPGGKDNIKSRYQFGGGSKGNVAAGEITKLMTALPFVDSVINPEASDGGGEKEDMDRARERGPQMLKHRDRAVTYEDYLWLVKAEFQKVAKLKCLPTTDPSMGYKPGWVTLIVVPQSDEPKPLPTQQLISEIQSFLFERSSTHITLRPQIHLINPGYIMVWVDARVQYTSITEAKTIESRIISNLNEFFHPLRGGPDKKGWDFGRNVFISEVYEVIENTDGVDYVDQLFLKASIQMYKLIPDISIVTQVSYPEHSRITLASPDGNIVFLLAEYLQKDTKIESMTVMGFKEGDILTLTHNERSVELKVKSVSNEISGDILQCEPFTIDREFPIGSIVKNRDGVESLTLNEVKVGDISLNPINIAKLKEGDNVVLSLVDDPATRELFKLKHVSDRVETIFLEDNYLVYSGTHTIYSGSEEIKTAGAEGIGNKNEMPFRYLININSREIHDLQNEHPNCNIKSILKKNKMFIKTLDQIEKYDYCGWCFGREMSRR